MLTFTEQNVFDISSRIRMDNIPLNEVYGYYRNMIISAQDSPFISVFDRNDADIYSSSMIYGVPFAVTENICRRGCTLKCGTNSLNYTPAFDAECISQLEKCGAMPIGYVSMPEFNAAPDGASPVYGAVDAVARGLVPFALCTDIDCSLLIQAGKRGICAIKPTLSICSRMGILSASPTVERLTLLAHDARDLFIITELLLKDIKRDTTASSTAMTMTYSDIKLDGLNKVKIAVADTVKNKQAYNAIWRASELFELYGAAIYRQPIELPFDATQLLRVIMLYEYEAAHIMGADNAGSDNFTNDIYESNLLALNEQTRQNILLHEMLCENITAMNNACKMRAKLIQLFSQIFSSCDAVICPVPPEYSTNDSFGQLISAISLCGVCCMTMPIETDPNGNSIPMLMLAREFSEGTLLYIAYTFEQAHHIVKGGRRGRRNV